ncbi:NOL1/NOP2/sun family putative RNA methylase [Ferroacidibacillus organovorans]|uniref:SAM-dependent MTase RsmB/NOP-type domain-containing protein n=1 Tax=Ferroacidibacillus organovorans TaxID=1765683 RepID=A0A853KDK5_9BACL|nr:NOL1/NOP2/sun family putative RNA methylase [Ferroacidibacillus organovorans]KYP81418.1 hypothetical protein AYJ22_01250 [Ferroacidibacillus organovorans]OAG95205.1 hypothetical protein AYW79_01850 [Ferroacidibacillus organovorans]
MFALPKEFESLFLHCFGQEAWNEYLEQFHKPPAKGFRVSTLKGAIPSVINSLLADPVPWTKEMEGFYIHQDLHLGRDPLHATGYYYLQEPSAMAPVPVLAPVPGERVLDLCAAPGGKTTQIAQRMRNEGILIANEPNRERCAILAENLERLGVTNATVTQLDPDELRDTYPAYFDAILVDAPCSGEGMFRKDDDAIRMWQREQLSAYALRQSSILHAAIAMLRPGGRLVYSTCTLNPIENEAVCATLLRDQPTLSLSPIQLPGARAGLTAERFTKLAKLIPELQAVASSFSEPLPALERTIRIMPQAGYAEGHFVAKFALDGNPSYQKTNTTGYSQKKRGNSLRASRMPSGFAQQKQFAAFANETFVDHVTWIDDLYRRDFISSPNVLFAASHRPLPSRNVLRPGLPLLETKHHHITPHHALALATKPENLRAPVCFSYGDTRIIAYLSGEVISQEGPDGWTVVFLEHLPLGWVKRVKNQLKNHYPKGLRRAYSFEI